MNEYEQLGTEIGQLVATKDAAYGKAFDRAGAIVKLLYPNGVTLDQYDDFLAVTRIVDKLFRIANQKDAFGESPFMDIAGYGLLGYKRHLDVNKRLRDQEELKRDNIV